MKRYLVASLLVLFVAASSGSAQAGDWFTLNCKGMHAVFAAEVELNFDKPVPASWEPDSYAPVRAFRWAMQRARVKVLFGTPPPDIRKFAVTPRDEDRPKVRTRGRVRAILLLRERNGELTDMDAVEGSPSDERPNYPEIREVVTYVGQLRQGTDAGKSFAAAEKLLPRLKSGEAAALLAEYFCSINRSDIVDRAKQAAKPGSALATYIQSGEPLCTLGTPDPDDECIQH